jgi:hypothetical protein
MGPLIGLLIFIGAAIAWCFFTFQPEYANKKALSVFNWSVLGACAMMCMTFMFYIKGYLSAISSETAGKYKLAFELIGALGIESVWLLVMLLIRNFWLFKPPRRPGGWG